MLDWGLWFAIAGTLVAIEIFTGTFYLLMLAVGCAVGGVCALLGLTIPFQLILASIVGFLATLLLKKTRFNPQNKYAPEHDPNINLDIGKTLTVNEWKSVPNGPNQARVSYRGTMWDVELGNGEQPQSGLFVIREIRSNRLIVGNITE